MKVLVTGSNGFLGKNFIAYLKNEIDIEIETYDIDDSFAKIEKNIDEIEIVYHFAGVNRPKYSSDFYQNNTDLTKSIIDLLNKKKKHIPFVFASSIQAELDNDYGKSKKQAEDYILNNYKYGIIYRFHNIFGKWCRPNYNSVVATFCFNISHNLDISINDENKELELIYIDDICETLLKLIHNSKENMGNINYIEPRYKKTVGEISYLLNSFKETMKTVYTPKTGDEFIKKLFATYVSYIPLKEMSFKADMHVDERGNFTELVRTIDSGQFSISVSKPGVFRGNHYHHTKMERFIVINGKARITFKSILDEKDKISFIADGDHIQIVTIPVGYTHKIENIGGGEMILALWCNELLDKNHPDTYFMEV